MSTTFTQESDGIDFEGGLLQPVVFLVLAVLVTVLTPILVYPLIGDPLTFLLVMSAAFGLVGGIAWLALRWEGLELADVGLGRANVVPGVALVFGIYALLNVLGAGYLLLAGDPVALALPDPYTTPVLFLAAAVAYFVFNGIAEELAFRAYLQNKLVALLDGGTDRTRKAAAILLGVGLFTLWHLPQRVLIQGLADPGAIAQTLVSVVVLGTVLGLLYEYTRNVVLVGVLHGTFNFQPFFVEGMPAGDLVLFVGAPALLVVVWQYRRWARRTHAIEFRPPRQAPRVPPSAEPSD